MLRLRRVPAAIVFSLLFAVPALPQSPRTLSYQGILSDTSGTPKPDGSYNFTFRLYTDPSGGTSVWSETKSSQVKRGLFSTVLGSVTPLPDSVKFDRQYWLGIQVASDPELSPRIPFTSVGSSFHALQADVAQTVPDNSIAEGKIGNGQVVKSLNGLHDHLTMRGANGASVTTAGDTITVTASGGGGGGIGTVQNTNNTLDIINPGGPTATLNVKVPLSLSGTGSSLFSATNTDANSIGILGRADQAGAVGVWGQSNANTGVYGLSTSGKGVWGQSTSSEGIYGVSTNNIGVYGQTSSSDPLRGAGVKGINLATSGIGAGVWGASELGTGLLGTSTSGTGVLGQASGSSTIGVQGLANSAGGVGVWGQSDANTGVFGLTSSASGAGIWGQNQSTGPGALAVRGEITSSSPGSSSAAIKGINNGLGDNGIGVWGEQHGSGYGVYGLSPNGSGVFGSSPGNTGVQGVSNTGVGVKGVTDGAYSVLGQNTTSGATFGALGYHGPIIHAALFGYGNGTVGGGGSYGLYSIGTNDAYAGEFDGPVYVNGELSVIGNFSASGDKEFRIDHPLDPANKYLVHSCIESPDRMNIYNGNITTDGSGLAIVEMPGYFQALNIDYRYQLTVIGQFAQAIVEREIQGNQFTIRTDKPNVKVSWQVTGIRNDAYAKAHPMVVEKAKDANDKGKYLMPELFGQPAERGIHYRPLPGLPPPDKTLRETDKK